MQALQSGIKGCVPKILYPDFRGPKPELQAHTIVMIIYARLQSSLCSIRHLEHRVYVRTNALRGHQYVGVCKHAFPFRRIGISHVTRFLHL